MKPLLVDPLEVPGWNESLLSLPGHSIFHTSSWAAVLQKAYAYQPVYSIMMKDATLEGLLPCMGIRSLLTGKRGVALPYTDYCEPIVPDNVHFSQILAPIMAYGKKEGWKYLEFRGGGAHMPEAIPSAYYYGHDLDLTEGCRKIFANLRDSTRRNIGKAEKEKVYVTIANTTDCLKEFLRLNSLTRRNHGLPPQPRHFFQCLYDHIISRQMGFIVLAFIRNQAIAGHIYLYFGDEIIYKYGASDKAYQRLRANNLMIWETIRRGVAEGCRRFCFGRTSPENAGLRQFKSGWGAREYLINYYKYDLRNDTFVTESPIMNPQYRKIMSKLPIPILTSLGKVLYRHMG